MYGYENTTGTIEVWPTHYVELYLQSAEDAGHPVVWTEGLREVQVQNLDHTLVIAQFARLF